MDNGSGKKEKEKEKEKEKDSRSRINNARIHLRVELLFCSLGSSIIFFLLCWIPSCWLSKNQQKVSFILSLKSDVKAFWFYLKKKKRRKSEMKALFSKSFLFSILVEMKSSSS